MIKIWQRRKSLIVAAVSACSCLLMPFAVSAYSIVQVPGVPESGDFILEQGKTEVALSPGESAATQVVVTNRAKEAVTFSVSVEDFGGSKSTDQNLVFWGDQKSPYSLKDYLKPEISQFTLNHGERITLPVAINIPATAAPGGLYGAVIITAQPTVKAAAGANQVQVVPRLASLYFVRIKGDAVASGSLKEFAASKNIYDQPDIDFRLLFENSGTIFVAPAGKITIKNIIGKIVGQVDIPGFYVMPDSLRQLKTDFKNQFMFGYYTANLDLNRGYGNEVDERTIGFWVLPWRLTLAGLAGLIVVGWIISRVVKSFRR